MAPAGSGAGRRVNPGVWLSHCHELSHAAEGMTLHFTYEGVRSPYAVGAMNHPEEDYLFLPESAFLRFSRIFIVTSIGDPAKPNSSRMRRSMKRR